MSSDDARGAIPAATTRPVPLAPRRAAAHRPSMSLRLLVSGAQLISLYGTLFGLGAFGTRVRDAAGGLFRPEVSLLAPGQPSFRVWSVIYLGLFAYTVGLWLPGTSVSARLERTAWPASWAMILNAVWLIVVSMGQVRLSLVTIIVLVLVLGVLMRRLVLSAPASRVERLILEGTFGLYLGWVVVAVAANVALVLVSLGVPSTGPLATVVALASLVTLALVGVGLARVLPGQWGVVGGMVWGFAWIAIQRLAGMPHSAPVAVTALVAAAVVALAFVRTRPSLTGRNAAAVAS
ncbi:MAG TPA: tryptophan-rich sensory protein [Phycicoccus sp.]|nr:tryptophan-rich sensory protein [Phycicoccus sp.]